MATDFYSPTAPQLGAVRRIGNSYSGGNVSGPVTINGQKPAGTFSTISSGSAPATSAAPSAVQLTGTTNPAPAPAPFNPASGVGRPNALGSLADTNAQIASIRASYGAPTLGVQSPAPAAPPAAPLGVGRTTPSQPAAASASASASPQLFAAGPQIAETAPAAVQAPPPPAPAVAPAAVPQQREALLAFRDGGVVRGPGTGTSDSIPAMLSKGEVVMPADTVRALGVRNLQSVIDATHTPVGLGVRKAGRPGYANGGYVDDPRLRALGPISNAVAAAPSMPPLGTPGASQIPTGREPWYQASPVSSISAAPPVATQADVRRVDNGIDASFAAAPPSAPPTFEPAGTVSVLGGAAAADRVAQINRDAAHQRAMSDQSLADARAGVGVPATPGLGVIGPIDYANRNADFNERAALRTLVARGAPPGRNGAEVFARQLGAASAPIEERAALAQLGVREAGASQRALLAEQGVSARARIADARQQQANQIDLQRLGLDAKREDRAAAASATEKAQKTRLATLQDQVLNGTPEQRRAATEAIAAMQGREVTGGQPPAGYRRTADGNLEAIPGGPADLKQNKEGMQQFKDTQDIFSIIDQATPLLGRATASPVGMGLDQIARTVGFSTPGAEAGAELKALQGALISKMPKMSGPQSDKDVQLYREMAGQIGDPTIPREQRMAALRTVRSLNEKYLPAVTSAEEVGKLSAGTTFKAPDGTIRRKQ